MRSVFITGTSSGIGHALAGEYLNRDWQVYGVSRRRPDDLAGRQHYFHAVVDLADHVRTRSVVSKLLTSTKCLDLAVLNAGVLGQFDDLAQVGLDDLKRTMEINLWSNKTLMDTLFSSGMTVRQVVSISSGASINGNRGWAGYSLSKAALNMLTRLYAREHSDTHFCALAPGVVDTDLIDHLCALHPEGRFAALDALRAKRGTAAMPAPAEAAVQLVDAIQRLPGLVESGAFADLRNLPG
ncbi:MAG: SDR family NAD(P)-dependent oxidoreductase [Planctomycetales bacterium]|nr:SDR family NAD(P)-dependent oxidoreductase [Planctomycetales bacterium]NIM08442.1 SDR family NAD(P)-dependent oxidoreductase [Planctomycetales bacterium]NIN07918.1 SDR family NAD(P)-dependent oxidoreductase [Planctomycetales bacterium]NIN77048.1 SDR family NAD(P)-dependent oxidoreductase [Planctomycetales bacterium]NIO34233.1 SDR family NAD(P)-dependent oxidoreductase [Planctomycetales bacterium]